MRVLSILTAATATAALSGAPASAETYGKLFGGANLGTDHDYEASLPADTTINGSYDTDLGYTLGGAYGVDVSPYVSLEGELAYRSNGVDAGQPYATNDENINALSLMANGVLKGPGGVGGVTPYAGAGVGGVRLAGFDDNDIVSAYQLFGGVKKDFGAYSAGVEYRYLDAGEGEFGGPGAPALKSEYDSHGFNVTLSRKF